MPLIPARILKPNGQARAIITILTELLESHVQILVILKDVTLCNYSKRPIIFVIKACL